MPSPRINLGERPAAARHTWTPLARRLGVTRTAQQRREILYAAEQIDWTTGLDTCLGRLGGRAAQVLVAAIHDYCGMELRLIGTATLPDGAQLVGLEHANGTRNYLLDLDVEAIHVLAEAPRPADLHVRPHGASCDHSSSVHPRTDLRP